MINQNSPIIPFIKGDENKSWFTLVELIVVITILAILWTIAFISLQWFSKDARNSTRHSDLKNIEKVLSLYQLRQSEFPLPSNEVEITYSWAEVWTQWTFWEDTRKLLGSQGQISNVPLDPLTWSEYTYSRLNTKNEMQLAAVFEWELTLNKITNTFAGWSYWTTKITWNYNWQIAKASTWWRIYVLAIPSIISSDTSLTKVIDILDERKLIYNWFHNLPASYSWTTNFDNPDTTWDIINTWSLVVYSWLSIDELLNVNDATSRVLMLSNLQKAYSGALIYENPEINKIINIDLWKSEDLVLFSAILVNNNLGWNIQVNTSLKWWKSLDLNCDINDIHIPEWCIEWENWCQVWAGCNSTLWNWIEFINNHHFSCWDYAQTDSQACSDAQNLSSAKEYAWNSIYWINNIWWKLYIWDNSESACAYWWHVPSDEELTTLENTLFWSICAWESFDRDWNWTADWDGLWCDGLWWKNHTMQTLSNNMIEALKLPLPGYRTTDGLFYTRGYLVALLSSTLEDFDVRGRVLYQYYSNIYRGSWPKTYAMSVRCIKN